SGHGRCHGPTASFDQALALRAEECAPARGAEELDVAESMPVARAGLSGVHLVVLLQLEGLAPAVEVEAVVARLAHQVTELASRQGAGAAAGMQADALTHFVLDDVADAGEYTLVQQHVGDHAVGRGAQLASRLRGVPAVGHHVTGPIVDLVRRLGE